MKNGEVLQVAFPSSRCARHQTDFPVCMGTRYCKGQHAKILKANKAKCFCDGKGLVDKLCYLAANLPFSIVFPSVQCLDADWSSVASIFVCAFTFGLTSAPHLPFFPPREITFM